MKRLGGLALTALALLLFAAPAGAWSTPAKEPGDHSSLNYGHIHESCGQIDYKLTGKSQAWTLTIKEDGQTVKTVKRTTESNPELVTVGFRASSDAPHKIVAESNDGGKNSFDQAYIWIDCGPVEGKEGPPGERGTTGATGPAGPEGQQGPRGQGCNVDEVEIACTGPAGPTGPTGPQGPEGARGVTGAAGPAGGPGLQGVSGASGPALRGSTPAKAVQKPRKCPRGTVRKAKPNGPCLHIRSKRATPQFTG